MQYSATILDPGVADDLRLLQELRDDPMVDVMDRADHMASTLERLRPPVAPDLLAESRRWAYFPWRRTLVSILGPRAYARARLDRNRHLITAEEQQRLCALRIGVVGLSVGHGIAHALATQGLCGELHLADFDHLELSNLNRVPATLFDIGVNKAVAAARRIAEIDPYVQLKVFDSGLTPATVDAFIEGVDILVEECDSLDIKALLRETARARRRPVLMATSDRGLIDVERFDTEPERPIFHGLLGDADIAGLSGLTDRDKIPHVLRILEAGSLSARGAASLIEVGHTLSTWPQLAGDAALGVAAVAEAVRRIGLDEDLTSGRGRIDVAAALDGLADPTTRPRHQRIAADHADVKAADDTGDDVVDRVVAAAVRAPSGGNAQPWDIVATRDSVTISVAPQYKSMMDVGFRASAVAVGAAVFNARIAAAAHGVLGPVEYVESDGETPLRACIRLAGDDDADLAQLYPALASRETNRHRGVAQAISDTTADALTAAAASAGTRLNLLTSSSDIGLVADLFAAADRIRYLTPSLHAEMASELRWPGDESPDSGIDVRSLELDADELLTLDILRRPEVMAKLAEWDAGAALGTDTRSRVAGSSALAVITVAGRSLIDYAQGGSALQAVWLTAQGRGLAVQPISPVFLYAQTDDELNQLSPAFAAELRSLQSDFRRVARTAEDEEHVLVLRLTQAPPASVRSRRRAIKSGSSRLP
jgi:molybdopterin/thiamine biosynthesis adenylyltransferase/nitroreductase